MLFSDRPDRIVISVSTLDFIGNWSTRIDSYSADVSYAILVFDDAENKIL